jgi:predicted site-specific integrase-resolvase
MRRRRRKRKQNLFVPKPINARRLANAVDACAYGQFSRTTLRRLIHSGKIKASRPSYRVVMVDLDSVDAYLMPERQQC